VKMAQKKNLFIYRAEQRTLNKCTFLHSALGWSEKASELNNKIVAKSNFLIVLLQILKLSSGEKMWGDRTKR
jgi:nitrous oxidase accessory protein NosD